MATAPVKFGLHFGSVNPRFWVELAEEADRLGYDSLWIPEHVVVPLESAGSPHAGAEHPPIPSGIPIFDVLAVLSHLAARTRRIRLGTHVYNVGLRHPLLTARAATTVDVLSGGRLDLGVGASWLRSEWDALGLDFDTRGGRIDETLTLLRQLWTDDVIEHHGSFFDVPRTRFEPKPAQLPLPLHIGGDGPAALRRAATVGTGWMPMNHPLQDLPRSVERLHRLAEDAGRTERLEITVTGTVESIDDLHRYVDAGATRVIVQPWRRSAQAVDAIRTFAGRFLEHGR